MDGGPLSGLAASIENSCNSQLGGASALNLAAHQQQTGGNGGSERRESGNNNGNGTGNGGSGGSQRTKRMRTSFKHHQLRTMKTYFSVNQNPDAKDLKQLAQKTGLSKRVLQVKKIIDEKQLNYQLIRIFKGMVPKCSSQMATKQFENVT